MKPLILIVVIFSYTKAEKSFSQALHEEQIVPDIVDKEPENPICVYYEDGKSKADFGNELTPTEVKNVPDVHWNADENAYYTLMMVDPDGPSRAEPSYREVLHWLVVNMMGANVLSGETIVEYIGAGPPQGTGLHRYVFLVYKQDRRLEFNESVINATTIEPRFHFSARNFSQKYHLGEPIAANFYQAQWDASVGQS